MFVGIKISLKTDWIRADAEMISDENIKLCLLRESNAMFSLDSLLSYWKMCKRRKKKNAIDSVWWLSLNYFSKLSSEMWHADRNAK